LTAVTLFLLVSDVGQLTSEQITYVTNGSNIMVLFKYVAGYVTTLKVSKSKYNICYYFIGSSSIFHFFCINILNYRYFHTDYSTFVKKLKKRWKNI